MLGPSSEQLEYKRKEELKEILLQMAEMMEVILTQNHMMKNPNQMVAGNVNIQRLMKIVKKIDNM